MTDTSSLSHARRERAQQLQDRLRRMKNHGTLVSYQCQNCTFTTVLFGSDHAVQLEDHAWPPGIRMTCCEDSELRPTEARRGSKNQHNALLLLMQEGQPAAARKLWGELEAASVDELPYKDVPRPANNDENGEEQP